MNIGSQFNRPFVRDLFKYGFVAVFALAADAGTLWLLHSHNVQYLLATTVAFLIGTLVNFALSHGYVFHNPIIKSKLINFLVYVAIGAASLVFTDIIVWFCHAQLGHNLALSKLIAVVVVFFWNFVARRQFLYHGHKEPVEKEMSFEG